MIETAIRLTAGVVWELVLYGTGRLALAALSLGAVRAEALRGETTVPPWHGFGRDAAGALVVSQVWTGALGAALWCVAALAGLAALGRL